MVTQINAGDIAVDELLDVDPEPCQFCRTGVQWLPCFDGVWRCRNCVDRFASENGWNDPPPNWGEQESEQLLNTQEPSEKMRKQASTISEPIPSLFDE